MVKKQLGIFVSGLLAGFCIAIGVLVYLSLLNIDQKIIGSLFFGLGLFAVITFQLYLYTGKVGAVLDNKPKYFIDLIVCMLGNFIGIIALCYLAKVTRLISSDIIEIATTLVEQKQSDSPLSIFVLSIFCGIMIYLAVKGHEKCKYAIGKVIFVFLSVAIFILCGFEHCIANAGYYVIAGHASWKAVGYFMLMIIGNGIGAIAFDGLIKLVIYLFKPKEKTITHNNDH